MSGREGGILNTVVRISLRLRGVVIALAMVFVVYGTYTLSRAKYDVFPEFAPPLVVVQTEAPGLAPEQVEALVTLPVENSVGGIPGVETMRSSSIQGLSVVTLTFEAATDVYRDRQIVAERIATVASQLPQGVQAPAMTPLTSSTSTVLIGALVSNTRSLMDLRTIAEWTVRPRLLAVPGVANVSVFGGDVRQIQIQVQPDRLIQFNLGLSDVLAAAERGTGVRGAGFIDTPNQRVVIQTQGQSITAADIARTVLINQQGVSVTLENVAHVVDAAEPPIGAASVAGQPSVGIVISQQYGSNTLEVTRLVEQALNEVKPTLRAEGVTLRADLFRPANFITTATRNIRNALLLGGVLVIAVLFLFLFDLRTAAISVAAIPLSLLAGVVVLERLGLALNTMTLGGLAIAIGAVVDDAVIDVENILRRLRENRHAADRRPAHEVVLSASLEMRSAIVYATFAITLVFLPILTISGTAGRLFAPLGVAYIAAILASLVVALTLTPALSYFLLANRQLTEEDPPVVRWLKVRYRQVLARVEERSRPVIFGALALTLVGLAILPFFGGTFLPELKEGHFIVHMSAVPGTSIDESLRIGARVSDALLKLPAVRSVSQHVGRSEKADDVWGTHYSELNVDLHELKGGAAEFVQSDIRAALSGFPGVNFAVKPFLTERVEETLSGYTASVVVNLFGNDLDVLDQKAEEVARVVSSVQGAAEVQVQSPPGMPQLNVRLRGEDVARWGFHPLDVLDVARTAYGGNIVGQIYDGNRVWGVSVILDPSSRQRVTDVGSLPLRNAAGTYVRLRQLADVNEMPGRYQILHQGARRVQTVTANVAGRDVASFTAEVQRNIAARVKLPPGTYVQFTGAAEAQARSRRDLILHSMLAAVGIVLLLSIVMRHWRNVLLVLANVPFALVGGVFAVFAFGGSLSVGSLVGFVTVFGITLRNSIMMISHYEHLVAVEGRNWNSATAFEGAMDRLSPIAMTSLVTALGLLPLAIGMHAPGREIEGPMALVILGGLATSAVLNLLVLPALALRYGRFTAKDDSE